MKVLHDIPEVRASVSTLRQITEAGDRMGQLGGDWFETYYRDLLNQPVQNYQREYLTYRDMTAAPGLNQAEREIQRLRTEVAELRRIREREYENARDYYRMVPFPDEIER